MRTTERNWSAVADYKGHDRFVSFLTQQEWIQKCLEWYDAKGYEDGREQYEEELNALEDWELMDDIQDTWGVEIIETTWLKVGNECAWRREENMLIVKILAIPSEGLTGWSPIGVEYNGIQYALPLNNLYGLTGETCHKCGHPLYVSDLCQYMYVCLECDENFC
jgi:hypothetical protein